MSSNRQLTILALSIFLGVVFPQLAALCKPLLLPAIFLLFTFAIFQVRFRDVYYSVFHHPASWIILFWQLVFLPLCVSLVLSPWNQTEWYLFAVVAMCTSSITATTALAKIFNLNDALALVVCLVGTILMPVPLYIFLNVLVETSVTIDLSLYVSRILTYIVLPFLLVALVRWLLSVQSEQTIRQQSPVIVLFLLMVFGLSVMDGVRDLMTEDPQFLLLLVLLAFGLNLSVHLITHFCLRFIGQQDVTTACLLCAYRNMGMVAAIAGASLGEYFFIFVGVWQLPMYTLPLILKKIYQYQPSTAT